MKTSICVNVTTVPSAVYTATQGIYMESEDLFEGARAETQNLSWLFHLVLHSLEKESVSVEEVAVSFRSKGEELWRETFSKSYLSRMEWIEGAFEQTTQYFFEKIEFVGSDMVTREKKTSPDIPPGGTLSWVRIPFGRPWFARIDTIKFRFKLRRAGTDAGTISHTVKVTNFKQRVRLRLPFSGVWSVAAGNDLGTGHRRTGLNGVTTFGYDFVKIAENGSPYRTDGKTPSDYHVYGETVLAAADGVVVDVRNDIADFGIGETPPLDVMRKDGDVLAGNFVTIDHGNGEYSLTCHMQPGSIPVKMGDHVKAGHVIGSVGNSGNSQFPHIHFNLMNDKKWLKGKGLPALFSSFEWIRPRSHALTDQVSLGSPITGWLIRPLD